MSNHLCVCVCVCVVCVCVWYVYVCVWYVYVCVCVCIVSNKVAFSLVVSRCSQLRQSSYPFHILPSIFLCTEAVHETTPHIRTSASTSLSWIPAASVPLAASPPNDTSLRRRRPHPLPPGDADLVCFGSQSGMLWLRMRERSLQVITTYNVDHTISFLKLLHVHV